LLTMSSKDLFFNRDSDPTTGFWGDGFKVDSPWVVLVATAVGARVVFAGVAKSATLSGPGVALTDLESVFAAPNKGTAGFAGVAKGLELPAAGVVVAPPNNGLAGSDFVFVVLPETCGVLPNNAPLVLIEVVVLGVVAAGFPPNRAVVAGVPPVAAPNKFPVVAVVVAEVVGVVVGAVVGAEVAGALLPNKFPVVVVAAGVVPNRLGF
jgi:hypothetical protein